MKWMGSRAAAWSISTVGAGMLIVFVSFAMGQAPAGQGKPPASDLAAQREEHSRQMEHMIMQVMGTFTEPVDVYMVGSDMKQPTFADVKLLGVVELPSGILFSGTQDDGQRLFLNPSQVAAVRFAKKK